MAYTTTEISAASGKNYNFNKGVAPSSAPSPSTPAFSAYLGAETQPLEEKPAVANTTPSTAAYIDPSTYEVPSEDQDFTFDDFIDIINPMHHIPVIGTIYRGVTGDTIKPAVRMVGDILYGAVAGSVLFSAATSLTSLAIEQQTGEEPATLIADALFGSGSLFGDDPQEEMPAVQLASASATPLPQAPAAAMEEQADQAPLSLLPRATPPSSAPSLSGKAPYGGVMATAQAQPLTQPIGKQTINKTNVIDPTVMAQVMAQGTQNNPKGLMRIGNKVFPSTGLQQKTSPTYDQLQTQAKMAAATVNPTLPGSPSAEGKNLGQIMQESSDLKTKGGSLPPSLVHDMMLMALDKYKTASGLSPSEMKTSTLN